jgi:hypothetical protein
MKKLAVLSIVLMALAATAFAQVKIEPKVTLAAWGQLTWGIDLSTFDTGFKNESDADLTVTFIAADSTDTHKGEGKAYGEIKISDIEFFFGGDDVANDAWGMVSDCLADADVSAKIVMAPFEFGIFAAPTMYVDSIVEIEVDANDDNIVDIEATHYAGGGGGANQPFATTYGTWAKGTFGPLAATLKIASSDWTQDPADNGYAVGLDGVLTVTPATVNFGGYADWESSRYGFYAKAAATFGPLAFWAGFEGNYTTAFSFVAGGNVTFTLVPTVTLAATAMYGDPINGLDVKVVFTEPAAKGLVDNLDFTLTGYLLDLGTDMEFEVIATGGYKVMMGDVNYVRPYATFKYGQGSADDVSATADYTNYMYAEAGVQFQLIPLTLFTVKYVSGDLAADGAFVADTGSVQFVAKVTY